MGSLSSAMPISTPPILLLILPILASSPQGVVHGQPGGRALQWDESQHGGPRGSETWYIAPAFHWQHHLQSKRYWRALIDNPFPNRFGKITKREIMLEKKDKDGPLAAEKMMLLDEKMWKRRKSRGSTRPSRFSKIFY